MSTQASIEQNAAASSGVERLLDRNATAVDQIYGSLREEIITCRLLPNESISENRVCGMFQVSRSPVRIALTRLANAGLVDIFPQRGTFVAPIKMREVIENQFVCATLEIALVEVAARKWTSVHALEATANLSDQWRHAESGETWEFYLDNERFHQLVARAAELEGVWRNVQSVKTLLDRVDYLANRVAGHRLDIIAEHEAIVETLNANNTRAAVKAMKVHLRSAFNRHQPFVVE
jgi:DNA-binding GntR family transcriptional regulator